MDIDIFSILACILYLLAGFLAGKQLRYPQADTSVRSMCIAISMSAVVLHAISVSQTMFGAHGVDWGIFNAFSFSALCIVAIYLIASLFRPLPNLGVAIMPIAGIALLLDMSFTASHILPSGTGSGLKAHILFSILAYSLLSLAALQAIVLSIQDRHLHGHHPGGFIRALPPLETMESLLFQMIWVGFVLLSISLGSGIFFLEDIFAQHLVHKTALSITAWIVFGTLLWGRHMFGWRGRVAIRWTLTGFLVLLLAYFGSKMVLELILHR